MDKKFVFVILAITAVLSLSSISYAILPATYTTYAGSVTCQDCSVGMCTCSVTGCSGGLLRFWKSDSCTGMWDYEYTVVGGSVDAKPAESGTMYARVYDGKQYCTSCDSLSVRESSVTTPTETETATNTDTETETTTIGTSGGDYTWTIFIILLIILVIGAVVYYFLILKKKPAAGKVKTYEDLYRKWPKRQ